MTSRLSLFLIPLLLACKPAAIPVDAYAEAAATVIAIDGICQAQGRPDCDYMYERQRVALHRASVAHDSAPGTTAERCAFWIAGTEIVRAAGIVGLPLPEFVQTVINLGEVCNAAVVAPDGGRGQSGSLAGPSRPTEL